MSPNLGFAYAQARIQARFAGLPQEEEWQRLAASRTLASFLEEARTGPLRGWVKGFSGQSGAHELEAGVRSLYREMLDEVASWVPNPWKDAVSWVRWLNHLPLLAHLAAGGSAPLWTARDPDLRPLIDDDGALDPKRLAGTGLQCLLGGEEGLARPWIVQWRSRWPRCCRETARNLEGLTALLAAHVEGFRRSPPSAAWSLRRELHERLRSRFHRRTLQPEMPFIFITLTALDLERLRASLVSRALFSAPDEPPGSAAVGQGGV